ncbi:MAG TPA: hypothetical protein VD968_09370, partial [Pyrinomonadaceae bacterium]|nr:hypothetical protein [Pyrinomonadaceae bacterium]
MSDKSRNVKLTRVIIFAFGFLASYLPLIAGYDYWFMGLSVAAFFLFAVLAIVVAWSFIERRPRGRLRALAYATDWSELMTYVAVIMGFGAGMLAYVYRFTLDAFWVRVGGGLGSLWGYIKSHMDSDRELFLASMIFLGVILGFYVVRNWLKDEEDFLKSLRAVIGGAFLTSLLGLGANGLKEGQDINMLSALAHYGLGFTLSAVVNLLIYAWLTSIYSKTLSPRSRALIFFLYGTDKAKALDDYFLHKFEENKDSAKLMLVEALKKFRDRVLEGYAERMERRRAALAGAGLKFYRLISVERLPSEGGGPESPPHDGGDAHIVRVEEIDEAGGGVKAEMFRMGVTAVTASNLEYVVAPGDYKEPFPLRGSVAGLAMRARQSIVMNRDRNKKFRTKDDKGGITPPMLDRGFEEIDYLSYVSVPVVSNVGYREE